LKEGFRKKTENALLLKYTSSNCEDAMSKPCRGPESWLKERSRIRIAGRLIIDDGISPVKAI